MGLLLLAFMLCQGKGNLEAIEKSSFSSHSHFNAPHRQTALYSSEEEIGELKNAKEGLSILLDNLSEEETINLHALSSLTPHSLSRKEAEELVGEIDDLLINLPEANEKTPYLHLAKGKIASSTLVTLDYSPDLFYQLPLEDWEKKIIRKIVLTMANKNVFQLLLEKKTMEKRGRDINHVHPLRFMGYVFSDPELKRGMAMIRKSHFKWHGFIDGFSRRIREESKKDNLLRYVPGFCQTVQMSPNQVIGYLEEGDWEGFVKVLIEN